VVDCGLVVAEARAGEQAVVDRAAVVDVAPGDAAGSRRGVGLQELASLSAAVDGRDLVVVLDAVRDGVVVERRVGDAGGVGRRAFAA
jgi:hypothetical protein